MLTECFYILFALGATLVISFKGVTLLTETLKVDAGSVNLFVRNVRPTSLIIPPISFVFTSDELSFALDGPGSFRASASASLFDINFLYVTASIAATITGSINLTKNSSSTCGSTAMTMTSCDLNAHLTLTNLYINTDFDLCETAEGLRTNALMPEAKPLEALPALEAGATSIKKGSFFRDLQVITALGNLLGAPITARFVSDTTMHFSYGILLPINATVDTRKWSGDPGARLLGRLVLSLWGSIKPGLGLSNIDSALTTALQSASGVNIPLSMASSDGFLADLINNNSSLYLKTNILRSASLDFDLVTTDYKCGFLNLGCTLPVDRGLQVINVRFAGFGDADNLITNLLSSLTEDLLNRAVTEIVTAGTKVVGDRRRVSIL